MNARERRALGRIDGVIKTIGSLTPRNPADLKAIMHNLPLATRGAKSVSRAIEHLIYQEWEHLDAELAEAEEFLKAEPEPSRFDRARSVPTGQEAEHG